MKNLHLPLLVVLSVLILSLTGCQKNNDDQTGILLVKITDGPFPFNYIESASVTITKVEIRSADENNESSFITLIEDTLEFNLIELRNGTMAFLLEKEVPAGNYNLIRLYVDKAAITVKDHGDYTVKVPSGSETGIKVFIEPSLKVAGGLTTEIFLDFNLESSFVLQGNLNTPAGIKGFSFKPVIRAVNNTNAGFVEGLVLENDSVVLPEATVWIIQNPVVNTTYTNNVGYYAIPGVPAGFYSISATKEGYDTVTVDNVEIVEGNRTVQHFKLNLLVE